ncbi:hypothetical protein C8Q75DRAFT_733757 [Abortiporus biennis]|nr:hypothetical protein C8Q75DRAFT_733757 [Abortiporus biennis]
MSTTIFYPSDSSHILRSMDPSCTPSHDEEHGRILQHKKNGIKSTHRFSWFRKLPGASSTPRVGTLVESPESEELPPLSRNSTDTLESRPISSIFSLGRPSSSRRSSRRFSDQSTFSLFTGSSSSKEHTSATQRHSELTSVLDSTPSSSVSLVNDMPMGNRGSRLSASNGLSRVPEDELPTHVSQSSSPIVEILPQPLQQRLDTHADGLPTYDSAAFPTRPTSYHFVRSSPFSMVVVEESIGTQVRELEGHGVYHISVGLNVWMPNCTVTTIRRGGSDNGRVVAELELGIMEGPATITIGSNTRPLNEVVYRKTSSSSSRTYVIGGGNIIKWKLGQSEWNAYIGLQLLATFVPLPPPSRKLTLQPAAHARQYADHILIAVVILMREYLTPQSNLVGEAVQLFNYSHQLNLKLDL